MSDLQAKFKRIISDVEKNINDEKELNYVKNQIYNVYNLFMDEFDKIEEKSNAKINNIIIKCKTMENRMKEIEDSINKIETDIYIEENDEEFSFDITCPYCDAEFTVDCSDELKDTVTCPECNNVIELDWNEHEGCSHDCCDCGEDCEGHNHHIEDEDM